MSFFSQDGFCAYDTFLSIEPDKFYFIRDWEKTRWWSFNNLVLNQSNELEFRKIIDLAVYPGFMMKFILKNED